MTAMAALGREDKSSLRSPPESASPLSRVLGLFVLVSAVMPLTVGTVRVGLLLIADVLAVPVFLRAGGTNWFSAKARRNLTAVIVVGIVGVVVGFANANPGASEVWRVWILWPLLLGFALLGLQSEADWQSIFRTLDVALIMVSTLVIVLAVFGAGMFPHWLIGTGAVATTSFESQITFPAVLSLIFLVPYGIVRLASPESARSGSVMVQRSISVVLGVAATILGGQRSIFLGTVVGVGIVLLSDRAHRSARPPWRGFARIVVPLVIGGLVVWKATDLNVLSAIEALASENDRSDVIRSEQFRVLWDEWSRQPITGHGFGHVVDGYIRNDDFPWAYEILPLVILMSVGPIGVLIYIVAMWTMLRELFARRYHAFVAPILSGVTAISFATVFNPVVTKLGTMWTLFLAAGLANWFRNKDRPSQEGWVTVDSHPPDSSSRKRAF